MPQNNYLPVFQATYPLLAPYQKPPGVTVSTTATAPRVPNKFVYAAGTIQMVEPEDLLKQKVVDAVRDRIEEHQEEAPVEETPVEETPVEEEPTEEEDTPHRGGRGRRR